MTKTLLFDFDGVLVDSFDISYKSSVLSNHGKLSLKLYRKLFEGNIYEGLEKSKLKRKDGVDFYDHYGPRLAKLKMAPHAAKVLKILAKKYTLIIVSSTPGIHIEKFLKRHGISKYFTEILGADFHTSKVNKIKYILKKYFLVPRNCLFITDTLGDIREARKCQIKSLAVTDGFHPVSTLNKGKPVKILKNFRQMPTEIEKYFATS